MHPRFWFISILILCLTACRPQESRVGFTPFFESHPTPTATPQLPLAPTSILIAEPTAAEPAMPPTSRPPAKAWSWQPVGEIRTGSTDVYYTGETLVWTQKIYRTATAARYILYTRIGDQMKTLHEAPGEWRIEMARMAAGRIAVLETLPTQPSIIRVFDLQADTEQVIGARDGEYTNPKYPPYLGIDEEHLVWNSFKPDGRTCLRAYQFLTDSFVDLFCTDHAMDFLTVRYLRWPVVTYDRTITGSDVQLSNPGIYSQIGPLSSLNCSGSQEISDGLTLGCLGKDPQPNNGIPVVGVKPLAFDPTLQVCDGRAFWLPDQTQVRSWMPGGSEEIIYRTLVETEQIEAVNCTDGWVTVTVSGAAADKNNLTIWAAPISY